MLSSKTIAALAVSGDDGEEGEAGGEKHEIEHDVRLTLAGKDEASSAADIRVTP